MFGWVVALWMDVVEARDCGRFMLLDLAAAAAAAEAPLVAGLSAVGKVSKRRVPASCVGSASSPGMHGNVPCSMPKKLHWVAENWRRAEGWTVWRYYRTTNIGWARTSRKGDGGQEQPAKKRRKEKEASRGNGSRGLGAEDGREARACCS